jgi:hypothetical protein
MPAQAYVTIAQALASSQTGLLVQDTAAAIAGALPNPALVARVSAFSLSANALITTAVADKLAALGSKFQAGGPQIVVQDTLAAMNSASNASGLAIATSRTIIDAAYNLLSAAPSSFAHISNVILTGAPILSVAQLAKLEGLPGFAVQAGAQVTLQDSLTDFVPALSAHGAWLNTVATLSVRLDGSQIGAAGVASLAALATAGKTIIFVAGSSDTLLNITASAHDLAGAAASVNRLGGMVGLHITISNEGAAVTAADAQALMGITGFSPAAHTVYVADTGAAISANAAALFGHGFPQILVTSGNFAGSAAQLLDTSLHLATGATVSMTGSASLNAAQAEALSILPGFTLAPGASLAVSDTAANILANASGLGTATSISVTDSETVQASGLSTLALLAASHPGHFSLGGHTLSVSDTAANLLALSGQAVALATSFGLSADATVTAAQFTTLRDTLHTVPAGHAVTILDSAAHLLALSGSLSLATACVLTGPAVVSAADAQTLAAEPGFSTGGYALGISDSAANLLALSPSLQNLANSLTLASSQTVSLAQLAVLVGWGAKFGRHSIRSGGADITGTRSRDRRHADAERHTQRRRGGRPGGVARLHGSKWRIADGAGQCSKPPIPLKRRAVGRYRGETDTGRRDVERRDRSPIAWIDAFFDRRRDDHGVGFRGEFERRGQCRLGGGGVPNASCGYCRKFNCQCRQHAAAERQRRDAFGKWHDHRRAGDDIGRAHELFQRCLRADRIGWRGRHCRKRAGDPVRRLAGSGDGYRSGQCCAGGDAGAAIRCGQIGIPRQRPIGGGG